MVLDSQRPYWSKWVRVVCCWFESQPGKTVSVEKENLAELIKLENVTICSLRLQKVVTSHFLRPKSVKKQYRGRHTLINLNLIPFFLSEKSFPLLAFEPKLHILPMIGFLNRGPLVSEATALPIEPELYPHPP